jgi:hypothetical protein
VAVGDAVASVTDGDGVGRTVGAGEVEGEGDGVAGDPVVAVEPAEPQAPTRRAARSITTSRARIRGVWDSAGIESVTGQSSRFS